MLDVTAMHPLEACAAFAVRFIRHLAGGDLAAAESLIDVNDSGSTFASVFVAPVPGPGGFSYAHPDRIPNWSMHVFAADEQGLLLDFEVPFAEAEYAGRALLAQFDLRRKGTSLEVHLLGASPN